MQGHTDARTQRETGLPLEVWLNVTEQMNSEEDIFALAKTCGRLYYALRPVLYRFNAENSNSSALLWAAESGMEEVARYAISLGADVNTENDDGDKPLHLAARYGNESIVTLLLNTDVDMDPDEVNSNDETPLICAASQGHGNVVRQLLRTGAVDPNYHQVNQDCGINRSALLIAANEGFTSVVEAMLEEEETDVDCEDDDSCTPLDIAASNGGEEIVRLLLNSGRADVNHGEESGSSPLLCAAHSGHAGCVALLLSDPRVNIDIGDRYDTTAFVAAAARGHMNVIRVFLAQKKVDADALDSDGNTLSMVAAKHGNAPFFKDVRSSGNYQSNSRNNYGQTPLIVAAEGGSLEIVKLIMEAGDADANFRAEAGETAFLMAVAKGCLPIVNYFIQGDFADLATRDTSGATALIVAAANGHLELVDYFLTRNLVDATATDEDGDTVLSVAASGGHLSIVKRCLESEEMDISAENNQGWTAFMWACYGGHPSTVEFLLKMATSDSNKPHVNAQAAMHATCLHTTHRSSRVNDLGCIGNVQVLKLLEKSGADILSVDEAGYTPLHAAAVSDCTEMVIYLVYRDGTVSAKDYNGRTPHFHACMRGYATAAILANHAKTTGGTDSFGNTPILVATRNGHARMVRSMLESDPSLLLHKDISGRTLFHWAARQQNRAVGEQLSIVYQKNDNIKERVITELGIDVEEVLGMEYPPSEQLLSWTQGCDWCRVCCRVIGNESRIACCTICDGGSFVMCLECRREGRRCRTDSHEIVCK